MASWCPVHRNVRKLRPLLPVLFADHSASLLSSVCLFSTPIYAFVSFLHSSSSIRSFQVRSHHSTLFVRNRRQSSLLTCGAAPIIRVGSANLPSRAEIPQVSPPPCAFPFRYTYSEHHMRMLVPSCSMNPNGDGGQLTTVRNSHQAAGRPRRKASCPGRPGEGHSWPGNYGA